MTPEGAELIARNASTRRSGAQFKTVPGIARTEQTEGTFVPALSSLALGLLNMSGGHASMTGMDISVQRDDAEDNPFDSSVWAQGFQLGSSGGMVCAICACLVRQDPGSAKRHLAWHERLEHSAL